MNHDDVRRHDSTVHYIFYDDVSRHDSSKLVKYNFIHITDSALVVKGYATRERFLQRIRQNPPNLRKILSRDGVFYEIVIARHAQLKRF